MTGQTHSKETARWFFLLLGVGVVYLFWQIIEPYALVLLSAGIVAVVLSPIDRVLSRWIPLNRLRVAILVLVVFACVFLPLLAGVLVAGTQAADLIETSLGQDGWLERLSAFELPLASIPVDLRPFLASIDVEGIAKAVAGWAFENAGQLFSSTARLVMQTVTFFIALYYLLADRDRLFAAVLDLSPFQDSTDRHIVKRIVQAVRPAAF